MGYNINVTVSDLDGFSLSIDEIDQVLRPDKHGERIENPFANEIPAWLQSALVFPSSVASTDTYSPGGDKVNGEFFDDDYVAPAELERAARNDCSRVEIKHAQVRREIETTLDAMRTEPESQRAFLIGELSILFWVESDGDMLRSVAIQKACDAWETMKNAELSTAGTV